MAKIWIIIEYKIDSFLDNCKALLICSHNSMLNHNLYILEGNFLTHQ